MVDSLYTLPLWKGASQKKSRSVTYDVVTLKLFQDGQHSMRLNLSSECSVGRLVVYITAMERGLTEKVGL